MMMGSRYSHTRIFSFLPCHHVFAIILFSLSSFQSKISQDDLCLTHHIISSSSSSSNDNRPIMMMIIEFNFILLFVLLRTHLFVLFYILTGLSTRGFNKLFHRCLWLSIAFLVIFRCGRRDGSGGMVAVL